ncbi:MAG: antibiotic biosynthesis monooxygenase family protein, partial [Pseudonocardiaceae bacterium]
MNVFVPPEGQVDTVIEIWEAAAKLMKAKPGFISTQLPRGTGNSRVLVNMAVWEQGKVMVARRDVVVTFSHSSGAARSSPWSPLDHDRRKCAVAV